MLWEGKSWYLLSLNKDDIVEITAPEGYQNAGLLKTFSITTAGQQVVYNPNTVNVPIFGQVGVKKVRADDSNEVVPGVKFELLNADKTARAHDTLTYLLYLIFSKIFRSKPILRFKT